jgi:hypothetical protein
MNQCVTGKLSILAALISRSLVSCRVSREKKTISDLSARSVAARVRRTSAALIGVINCKLDRDESKRLRKSELSRCASVTDDKREFAKAR